MGRTAVPPLRSQDALERAFMAVPVDRFGNVAIVRAFMESESLPRPSAASVSLGQNEANALLLLDSIPDYVCAFDAAWRCTFLNYAARRLIRAHLGLADDLIGREVWEIVPAALGSITEREFRRAVRDQVPVEFDVFFPPWQRWFSVRAFPRQGGGLSVWFRDVPGSKQSGEGDAPGNPKYRALFESVEQGFCIMEILVDAEGRAFDYVFLETNPAFERHTGLRDAVGRRATELAPGLERHWIDLYGRVAETGEPARFEERSDAMGRDFFVYAWRIGAPELRRVALLFSDITARKSAEQEVARLSVESRARVAELETLLDVLPIGIGIALDQECRNIRLNPAFARMLGLNPGANASKTAPEDERPATFRVLDDDGNEVPDEMLPMQIAAREGRELRDLELTLVRDDGKVLRILEYASPLFDERGAARGSVGAFVDITERRQADERHRFLVRLDDAVRPLGEPEAIVATAARLLGEHLNVDRCAYADVEADEDTFNLTGDYCRGVPSIVGRYTFTAFGSEVLRLMRANAPYVVEDIERFQPAPEDLAAYRATMIRAVVCVPLHKAGRFVAAMAVHQATPRTWTSDEVALVLHVANRCWEALERARVTRVLAESEERFRALADNIAQLAWMTDAQGRIFWYNRRWFDFTGTTFEEMQRAGWESFLHPEHRTSVVVKWGAELAAGREWEDTFALRGTDGEYRWFLSRAFPIRDARGKVLRWFGTNTDVTEQRAAADALATAKEQAEAASRAKDEFLAALSHELRTPLTPVLLSAAELQEDERLPEDVRAQLAMMRRNIELEARLIDDLLDLTSISRGKLVLRLQPCDVHALLGLVLEIVRDEAQSKGLAMELQLKATRSHFQGDPARMQQVFWNLLKNAVKFTPIGGRIAIRTRDEGDCVVVEVSDSGIGIEPEALERIFLPFEQAKRASDHLFGGLGLGLAICKAIMEMHGGEISAQSNGAGRGATFFAKVPASIRGAQTADHAGAPAGAADSAQLPVRPLRLLLVEDHEPTLAVLARLLGRAGHTVATAMTAAAARELADRETYDAVISDIGLPDGTGVELMRALNTKYGLRGIALTGYGMEEDVRRSREAGFVAHLVKPVDFAQLRLAIAQLVSATR